MITFGKNVAKEICKMQSLTYLLLIVLTVENQCFWCSREHVVFNIVDRILIENLYKFKGYGLENVDTVNDLVLSRKGTLKCSKPHVKSKGRPAFITRQCTALFIRIFI